MRRPLDKNLLVISDLHLGEDLKSNLTAVSYLRRLATLERELVAFLDHYTARRRAGRPWRLVVNGDMVDFMSIQLMPDEASDSSDEERRYGLAHGEAQSLRKLERVLERHRAVWSALARFATGGNELVVVIGNHDVEFCFEAVQRRLRDELVSRGAEAEAVKFCPWFYYEEDLVYIEHGHQYDEYCSFDYQLHPLQKGSVTLSLAHAGMRYFANVMPQLNPHDAESWGFIDWMRWAHAQGARRVARVALLYAQLIRKLFELWSLLTDRAADARRALVHRQRLEQLAAEYRMAREQIIALDALRKIPVVKRLHKILVALFLDRLLLGVLAMGAIGFALAAVPRWWKVPAVGAVMAAAAVANGLLSKLRLLDSAQLLRRAPEAILRIVRAPFIVFGHSHHAEAVKLASGATYFNTGSFGNGGGAGFTHLVITDADGDAAPEAELCEWRDGASRGLGA